MVIKVKPTIVAVHLLGLVVFVARVAITMIATIHAIVGVAAVGVVVGCPVCYWSHVLL